jgi:hypothetical protein
MTKHLIVVISVLIFFGVLGANNALPSTSELDNVLTQYFEALRTGDLQMLRFLLSDELLERRSKMLSNPRYSEFLKSIYGHAKFTIIDATQIDDNQISFDIEVTSDTQTQIKGTIIFIQEKGEWKLQKERKNDWSRE